MLRLIDGIAESARLSSPEIGFIFFTITPAEAASLARQLHYAGVNGRYATLHLLNQRPENP
ncbi:hypothetical protein EMIT0P294_130099 [Pseudomonas sp. IT-P294]